MSAAPPRWSMPRATPACAASSTSPRSPRASPDLSDYGWSKAKAERIVAASGLDWTILRPPAVYGPGDRETFELFKMARRGLVALPPKGRFSVLHVEDLCRLILALLDAPDTIGETYEPDDGREEGWDHRHFARTLGRVFGKRAATVAMPKVVMQGAVAARPPGPPRQGQADPRPGPLFLPPRLGRRRRGAPARDAVDARRSAPPPASRRPPTGTAPRAGCNRPVRPDMLRPRRRRSSPPARPGRSDRHKRASGISCPGAPCPFW